MEKQELSIGGYQFYTERDARLAEAELKKIEYLEARMDYSRPEGILSVYVKSIQERIFRTPVGFEYLKKLQEFLKAQPDIRTEAIPDIPLYLNYSGEVRTKGEPVRNRIKTNKEETDKNRNRFLISLLLNFMLAGAIIAMFAITLNSDNPNILNYKKAITNQYASWEQELSEREQIIREKERECIQNK